MKEYNGQNQAFPTDAPQALELEKAFSFKPNGDIEISTWLDRQVRKFVPASRSSELQITGIQECLRKLVQKAREANSPMETVPCPQA
jgi:hypothetical protein